MSTNVEGQVSAQIDTKQMLAEVAAKSHDTDALQLVKLIAEDKYLADELEATGYDVKALLAGQDWRL